LRQRYDEVGLPCSSTMESPLPNAGLGPADPHRGRTCRRGCDRGRLRGMAGDERCAQAVREGRAGALPAGGGNLDLARGLPTQAEVTVAGGPLLPARFARRDRAGHRPVHGSVGLTGAMKGYDGVASYSWLRRSRRRVDSGMLQGESAARARGWFPLLSLTRAQR
jgi:hypothetical protein